MNTSISSGESLNKTYDYIVKNEKSRRIYSEVVKKSSDNILEKFIQRIAIWPDGIRTDMDVMYSDYEHERDIRGHLKNENNKKDELRSALILNIYTNDSWVAKKQEIKWLIDDKKVNITCVIYKNSDDKDVRYYSWTIDWQKITSEDALRIFDNYYIIAKKRTDRIEAIRIQKVKIWIRKKTGEIVDSILSA